MANQAAMAAAMGNEAAESRQDRPAPDATREGTNDGRRGRGERSDRNGRRNERKGERTEGESTGSEERASNPEVMPATLPAASIAPDPRDLAPALVQARQDDAQNEDLRPPRERRSRDRYGRERRERGDNGERNESAAQGSLPAVGFESNPPVVQQAIKPVAIESVAPSAMPVQAYAAPVQVAAPVAPVAPVAPAPVAVTAAIAPAAIGLPKVQSYDLPMQDLVQVAQSSGLQWVNSNAVKIAETNAAMAAEAKPVHVPRERAARVVSAEAPLVLVETKRDLRDVTLPFEKPAA